jgi:ATP-binding cassette subfamily B protein
VRPYARQAWVGVATNALARAFDLLPIVIVGLLVDRIGSGEALSTPTFVLYGVLILLTFLGLALFQSVSDYAWASIAEKVRHDVRVRLYRHLQRLEAAFFEERQTGDLMSVLSSDVDNLENFFSDATTSLVRIVITFLGTYGILFWMDWRLALLLFAPLPLVVAAVRFFATGVQPKYRRARQAVGSINTVLENNIQGMGVIQAYTAEDEEAARVESRSAEYRDAAIAAARERAKFIPLIYAIAGVSFAALIAGGAWLTFGGHGPSVGDYTSFILFAMRLVMPLFVLGMLLNQIQRCEASAHRIMGLFSETPRIADGPGALPLAAAPRALEFTGVQFSYPGRPAVLHGVSFSLGQGRVLGIVGPTGAGKSTLIKLLLRYYDPKGGEIRLDGRPLSEITLASLREHIGYVSQDAFLFSGTIAENIRLGSPRADDAAVREAARIAGADEFIDELPQGLDTLVGERGVKLSGGQRQRISLARAVLRDPAILVLDEATSAVDTRTEEIIQRNLHAFRAGRITLAVAHRLSTVRQSDEILVLVDGVVVERGGHDQLIASGGVYADLWAVQSGAINGRPTADALETAIS